MAENPSRALNKIGEVYDRIAFAGVGKYNEYEALRVSGVRLADIKGYAYGRSDVTAKSLANAYGQSLGSVFTEHMKPFEIEIMLAEVGEDEAGNRLFRVRYDGTLNDERKFCAIGGKEEDLTEALGRRYEAGASLHDGIRMTAEVFEEVEGRSIIPEDWEAAVLERSNGRRKFRRLVAHDIARARA